jgi:acyl phosphate:glycerol-3-phosphate acyltransferase
VIAVWTTPLIAYLLGSIPFGLLIVKMTGGGDLRQAGSGNIGAANVTRVAGPVLGIATLLLDAGKGYLAVWLARRWSGGNIRWISIAALAVVLGHMFSVWLRFRGGKGVATSLGAYLAISGAGWAVAAAAAVWLLVAGFWRYVSLASIAAAGAFPFLLYELYAPHFAPPSVLSLSTVLIAVLIVWKHRANMQRLIAGTENQLKLKR